MHVTPAELPVVQSDGLTLQVAEFGPVVGVLAEIPRTGSLDTSLEGPCDRPHWGVVLRGELVVERDGEREGVQAGSGFYVARGPAHRFFASRRTVVAGFVPAGDVMSPPLRGANNSHSSRYAAPPEARDDDARRGLAILAESEDAVTEGGVTARAVAAGPWVMTRADFGATSGYGGNWCDLPHWGMVLSGSAVIEYEDDVEVVSSGDFYYCPAGPPGHKFEAADGVTLLDFTPADEIRAVGRIGDWRPSVSVLEPAT